MDYDPREPDAFFDEIEEPEAPRRGAQKAAASAKPFEGADGEYSSARLAGSVITYDILRKALAKILKRRGMDEEEINGLAMYLLSFFGFSDAIIDNILDTDDRDVFYMLEEEGILTTSREESYTVRGKVWRIHYWIMRKREILELAKDAPVGEALKAKERGEFGVYDEVDPRVWARED